MNQILEQEHVPALFRVSPEWAARLYGSLQTYLDDNEFRLIVSGQYCIVGEAHGNDWDYGECKTCTMWSGKLVSGKVIDGRVAWNAVNRRKVAAMAEKFAKHFEEAHMK